LAGASLCRSPEIERYTSRSAGRPARVLQDRGVTALGARRPAGVVLSLSRTGKRSGQDDSRGQSACNDPGCEPRLLHRSTSWVVGAEPRGLWPVSSVRHARHFGHQTNPHECALHLSAEPAFSCETQCGGGQCPGACRNCSASHPHGRAGSGVEPQRLDLDADKEA